MVSVIRYAIRGSKGDIQGCEDIDLEYYDHAILYAIFEILIQSGIPFKVLQAKEEEA